MDDLSGMQVAAGAFGVVSVSALLMILTQRLKDYAPSISGRSAMAAIDLLSMLAAALVLYQVGVNWREPATYIALLIGTLSLGIIARGHYAALFHVKVAGMPPSMEAEVPRGAVRDPQVDDTRPLTDAERATVAGRFLR